MSEVLPTPVAKRQFVKSLFSRIARTYDLLNHLLSFGADLWWRRETARLVPDLTDLRLLDLAAGTGDLALALVRSRRPRFAVAADFAEPMLRIAHEKIRRTHAPHLRTSVADASALPFRDASFDVATIAFGIRNFQDPDRALRELRRVLAPGGRLFILEFTRPVAFPMKQLFALYGRFLMPALGGRISRDRIAYRYLVESIAKFDDPSVLAGRLADAGFQRVAFRRFPPGMVGLHRASRSGLRDDPRVPVRIEARTATPFATDERPPVPPEIGTDS